MTETNDLVAKRFGASSFDDRRLSTEKTAFARRLRDHRPATRDDILEFIACEAGRLTMTSPRPMLVQDLERDADTLFGQLVTTVARRKRIRVKAPDLEPTNGDDSITSA